MTISNRWGEPVVWDHCGKDSPSSSNSDEWRTVSLTMLSQLIVRRLSGSNCHLSGATMFSGFLEQHLVSFRTTNSLPHPIRLYKYQQRGHSPICNTVYNTTKQPLDGSMYEIEAESFTAARPKALVFDDLGMRLNNQLCFSRTTCCMFEVGGALMGEITCDITYFHAPIRNRLQVLGCLVAVNHITYCYQLTIWINTD